ncbi:MAG TPA: hypothetical protein VF297_32370 [Pyrinomonadaceae bacterium]
MLATTPERIEQVAQEAFDACQGKRLGDRWQRAIAKAKRQLTDNPYIHFTGASLLILSPDSFNIYEANGVCQCKAYRQGWPCWHRAAYRLAVRTTSH